MMKEIQYREVLLREVKMPLFQQINDNVWLSALPKSLPESSRDE